MEALYDTVLLPRRVIFEAHFHCLRIICYYWNKVLSTIIRLVKRMTKYKLCINGYDRTAMAMIAKPAATLRLSRPNCIYNPITAMEFSAMVTFQLDNTKR